MNVTLKFLKEKCACLEGVALFKKKYKNKPTDLRTVVDFLEKEDKANWASWIVTRSMTHPQQIAYAIFAAEQVIDIYEKRYPEDKRPRQAIEAARAYLKDPSDENKKAAYAATYAAVDAADAAAYATTYAAVDAVDAAAYATYAAAYAATYATYAVTYTATYATRKKMLIKIISYGLRLLEDSK